MSILSKFRLMVGIAGMMMLGAGGVAEAQPILTNVSFGVGSIPVNTTTFLLFTIKNPGALNTLTNISFDNILPVGLKVDSLGTNGCGVAGGVPVPPGGGSDHVGISALTLSPGGSCSITFVIRGIPAGHRSFTAGPLTSATTSDPTTFGPAILDVLDPPAFTKSFFPTAIPLGAKTTLSFSVTNNNPVGTGPITSLTVQDNFGPTLLVHSPTGIFANPAGCATTTVLAGSGAVTFNIASLAQGANCTFGLDVDGMQKGKFLNNSSLTTFNAGGNLASAPILVVGPPSLSKSFNPLAVKPGANTVLTFQLDNPNTDPGATLTNVSFTDLISIVGFTVVSTTTSCDFGGGPPTGTFSHVGNQLSFTGGILPALSSCNLSATLLATSATGCYNNITSLINSLEGGAGGAATATACVLLPPGIIKTFSPTTIAYDGTSTVSFLVTNPNIGIGTELINVKFGGSNFDDLGALGLEVVSVSNTCGASTLPGIPPAPKLSFSIPVLGSGASCTFTAVVRPIAATPNPKVNCVTAISTNGGQGLQSCDTLTVVLPPTVIKSFSVNPVGLGQESFITLTISNPNTTTLTGIELNDTFPAGMTVSTPATTLCSGAVLSGGPNGVKVTGVTLSGGTSCTVTVGVKTASCGNFINLSDNVKSIEGGTGGKATATLGVICPPSIVKSFNPKTILLGANSTLTFTITNPNNTPLTNINFIDILPGPSPASSPVLTIVTPPLPLTPVCGANGGTLINPGNLLSLSALNLPANQTCAFSVVVTGSTPGAYINKVTVNAPLTGDGNMSTDTLNIITSNKPPVLIKAFATKFVLPGAVVALTFTLSNPSSDQITNVGFTDVLPGGFLVTNPNGLVNTCGGVAVATPTTPNISLSGVTMLPGASCTLTLNVTAPNIVPPVYICNTTSTVTWSGAPPDGNPATTCITVGDKPIAPPDAFQIRYAAHLDQGDSYINLTNNGANGAPLAGPGFGYPVGNICVNAYVFSPDEQLISCCSCLVTPNGLNSLSVKLDLVSNTLTGLQPNSVVIKLLASQPVGPVCNAALPNMMNLAPGMNAWGTTIHQTPTLSYTTTETPFIKASLSDQELASITNRCANNIGNGSGFGICRSCRTGGFAPIGIAGLPENR